MKYFSTLNLSNSFWKLSLVALVLLIAGLLPETLLAQAQTAAQVRASRPVLFTELFYTRLAINTVAIVILVIFVYLPIHRKKDYFFTFIILNFLVFIIIYLIHNSTAFSSFGAGFGLIAFFSLLRLRTDTISMKDMTYLFVVLTLGLVNAMMAGPMYELVALNLVILAITYALDKEWLSKSIHIREIKVDNLDNIVPQQMDRLVADLKVKTGLDIQRVKILSVDFVKRRAMLQVYHY